MKLPKIETLIVFVFLACVALWAISRCGNQRSTAVRALPSQEDERDDRPSRRDTVARPVPTPTATVAQQPVNTQRPTQQTVVTTTVAPVPAPSTTTLTPKPTRTPVATTTVPTATTTTAAAPKYSTLYVTIDGLKMRKTPGLKGDLVTKLELYQPVFFLNQKSEKTEEISLGYEKVTDYWVKIRTKEGKEGWVFGAGVYYYKMKRKGVMD